MERTSAITEPVRRDAEAAQPPVAADPDELLVEAARDDPEAFRWLYVRHRDAVHRYLRSRASPDDAADLTATTFERALAGLRGYRAGPSGFRAWLLRIARNAAIDAARRQRPNASLEEPDAQAITEPGPDQLAIDAEQARELRALVAALPDPQRDAIVLRYAAGLTAREIGAVIGRSEEATQKLLTRALARLKESTHATD